MPFGAVNLCMFVRKYVDAQSVNKRSQSFALRGAWGTYRNGNDNALTATKSPEPERLAHNIEPERLAHNTEHERRVHSTMH